MAGRTFVVGDIHGETSDLHRVLAQFPPLRRDDTLVFLGDYLDRGPHSKQVIEELMAMPAKSPAKIVCLRGNHEDAWLRVCQEGWDEFVVPPQHGCLATLRSYRGVLASASSERPTNAEMALLTSGDFFPAAVVAWMEELPFWYENEHGICVHAGLPRGPNGFLHPSEVYNPAVLAWVRTDDFVRHYQGKRILFGHTPVTLLPPELSTHTPDDPTDMWESDCTVGLDTSCGRGGFLTAIELPAMRVYESRPSPPVRADSL